MSAGIEKREPTREEEEERGAAGGRGEEREKAAAHVERGSELRDKCLQLQEASHHHAQPRSVLGLRS